ncbi:MESP1 protein, partial [Halcyon senegalensis]|nr:MESP1 protein [Halcyon senegalensis]
IADATSTDPSAEAPGPSPCPPRGRRPGCGGQRGSGAEPGRAGGPGGPRQSASEREKLRMRRLAQALLRLRHYLPPALAPAGQSLTKIETLRLATRYIAHLSALLGLGEEALARRRGGAPPRHCPLCPQGLGCCQSPDPRRPPPDASPPGSVGWGSPPTAGIPPELHGAPGVGMETWGSPPAGPAAGIPPELHGAPGSIPASWASPLCPRGAVTPPGPGQSCATAVGTGTPSSCCLQPAAPPQPTGVGPTDTGPPGTPAPGSQLPPHHQLGTPPALAGLASPAPRAPPVLPSCAPARQWGGWS